MSHLYPHFLEEKCTLAAADQSRLIGDARPSHQRRERSILLRLSRRPGRSPAALSWEAPGIAIGLDDCAATALLVLCRGELVALGVHEFFDLGAGEGAA